MQVIYVSNLRRIFLTMPNLTRKPTNKSKSSTLRLAPPTNEHDSEVIDINVSGDSSSEPDAGPGRSAQAHRGGNTIFSIA
jgi:hypothetical protein